MANRYLSVSVFRSNEDYESIFKSEPCILESWGFGTLEYDGEWDELLKKKPWGCIVGCKDGSLYLFHPDLRQSKRKMATVMRRFSVDRSPTNVPYRRQHLPLSRSRNASPSGSQTNLMASTSKSRAVSGLNKEQVEAPKNYVDFEEEQERMRGLVADKSFKDAKDRSPRASPTPLPVRRADDSITLASLDSLAPSPLASPPLSPTSVSHNVQLSKQLYMKARIILRSLGYGHSVVSIDMIGNNELFLLLQESG
jgi:WD repeat-containing protein 7